MSDPIDIIRAVVRDELRSLRLGDLAVVTSIFPHTGDDDGHNHECSVKLREGGLELRKVPIATPHVGMVGAPRVGDLVLVSYVGGDPNRAVVIGRLYSEKIHPPLHKEDEWHAFAKADGVARYTIDGEESCIVTAGKTIVTVKKDGNVEIQGEADLAIQVKGKVTIQCTDFSLDASGNVDLGQSGAGVITEQSHKCYFTGKALVPSGTVKAKG
ncbi:MAG TPA: phage baseplate assembly protein V [Zoogloea sp.]|uniref:phage baseplate assembly protein V n=1 Tax=Zoogloea sp. TaxID=49181 RepID=UPI002BFD76F5|nr:phage baseplate assembly protein V [Zoogloea sp.]HMV18797.1 phage baseplate assembly protein V [Rhodocyclaceae bacterium]HMV63259.1 phage baseplate assembly protein V [Rhodocyclaceae bacterium]HMZ76255.1 phage baseplate assembly protein V [Rhodocyclaceae bacterium]HNA67869.1 phage baseplate assembly protein V [Rhodocyclaceae bacterium]HNB65969.1 phage baseplate assembly protein V [Rhodocyclaceae bacterium]